MENVFKLMKIFFTKSVDCPKRTGATQESEVDVSQRVTRSGGGVIKHKK